MQYADNKLNQLTRLAFLVNHHKVSIPKQIARYIPGGEWLYQLGKAGPGGVDVDLGNLNKMIELGSELGAGTEDEAYNLIKALVHENIQNGLSQTLGLDQVTKVYSFLERLGNRAMYDETPLALDEIDLDIEYLDRRPIGFGPLDIANRAGFVPSLILIIGKTGIGKTRLCLSIAESIKGNFADNVLFICNEFNKDMLIDTIKPQLRRKAFSKKDGDIFRPGSGWSAQDIFEFLKSGDHKRRAIFYDSPDVLATSTDDYRRFYLENEYKILARCRDHCALVVVTSQSHINAQRVSGATVIEAKAKTYYSDVVVPINQAGRDLLEVEIEKNRFGPSGGTCSFRFNHEHLQVDDVYDEEQIWDDLLNTPGLKE